MANKEINILLTAKEVLDGEGFKKLCMAIADKADAPMSKEFMEATDDIGELYNLAYAAIHFYNMKQR